jgi:hypothetical protein
MYDIHQSIVDEHGELDEVRAEEYADGIMAEFAGSPEGQTIEKEYGSIGWAATMIDFAVDHLGHAPAQMTLADFNEVLFDLFPRKVSAEAERAGQIFSELRAFWSFVYRQYRLDNARQILASLDDRTATRFEKEFANPASFGMAKSFVMLGTKAGFDMTSPEGLAAFQAAYNASLPINQPAPLLLGPLERPDLSLPGTVPGKLTGEALKKKRQEKKRQREAKKRNRSR